MIISVEIIDKLVFQLEVNKIYLLRIMLLSDRELSVDLLKKKYFDRIFSH